MKEGKQSVVILLAEDDDDDYLLTREAFEEARLINSVYRVKDGEELLEYLRRQGNYSDPATAPRPSIILLDLNMPRKDGREALEEIKKDPGLQTIPVVILTVSQMEEDIIQTYTHGASSYIRKPVKFNQLVEVIKTFKRYWLEIVELPQER
jgi:CheY-like chemotaxis protein